MKCFNSYKTSKIFETHCDLKSQDLGGFLRIYNHISFTVLKIEIIVPAVKNLKKWHTM